MYLLASGSLNPNISNSLLYRIGSFILCEYSLADSVLALANRNISTKKTL